MKRFSVLFIGFILIALFCSCEKKIDFFKKEPPEIPSVFRSETFIKNKVEQIKVITDATADGTIEFLIKEHETLNGIIFRSTPTGFQMIADGTTVSVNEEMLPSNTIFSSLGKAIRTLQKAKIEPTETENFFEYYYPDFVLKQDKISGNIVFIEFNNSGYIAEFIN